MPNLIKNDTMTVLVKALLITLIYKTFLKIDFNYILLINAQFNKKWHYDNTCKDFTNWLNYILLINAPSYIKWHYDSTCKDYL